MLSEPKNSLHEPGSCLSWQNPHLWGCKRLHGWFEAFFSMFKWAFSWFLGSELFGWCPYRLGKLRTWKMVSFKLFLRFQIDGNEVGSFVKDSQVNWKQKSILVDNDLSLTCFRYISEYLTPYLKLFLSSDRQDITSRCRHTCWRHTQVNSVD